MIATTQDKTVSIVIPACNEGKNIARLLRDVFAQEFRELTLREVIVCSDGSTDDTVTQVRTIADSRLLVMENRVRLGANATENLLLRRAIGSIVIMLNADIALGDAGCLERLALPIVQDATIGMTAARIESLSPRGFFESVLAVGHRFRLRLFETAFRAEDTVYLCNGRARAFARAFAEKLVLPDQCPEDSYSYFLCQKLGFSFRYVSDSSIFFRLPDSLQDHIRQSHRFHVGKKVLERYFSAKQVSEAYTFPVTSVIRQGLHALIREPLRFPLYLLILFFVRFSQLGKKSEQSRWELSKSSKQLYDL